MQLFKMGLFTFTKSINIKISTPSIGSRQESRLSDYVNKITVIRQIMSNKSRVFRVINATQSTITVVVSSLLLFMGFSGLPKIQQWISWIIPVSQDVTEFIFNTLVFILFVIGTLHLVFRFSEKQAKADQAISALAALGNEIDDIITTRGNLVISEDANRISLVRSKYEAIVQNIPGNSDREFLKAKKDLAKKEAKRSIITITPEMLFNKSEQERIVSSIILGSQAIVDSLIVLRSTSKSLYIGGGLIRNAVWDYMHGYRSPTPVDDVDVIHFDSLNIDKKHDDLIDERLSSQIPNIQWSTKNQARMHLLNNESAYKDLEDAIRHWPETSTSIIVRLEDDATLKYIAPYGYDDLLRLLVRPTPAFFGRENEIVERMKTKRWAQIWPRLQFILPG
jgi:uncharacterized protein